ncbi:putative glucan 1,3-beta-glucosidase D [Termitomyces sp. T112]|nr:putative glucan 1,3-beta-glucosidase D [Termitomyces sp. T112]
MASNVQGNVGYDPLPLTNDDHPTNSLYNAPPSPSSASFHTPQLNPTDLGVDSAGFPLGAAQPRFLGAALYDDAGAPQARNSYASTHNTNLFGGGSEYNGSVYALNDTLGATPLNHGPYAGGYRDDPTESFGNHAMSPMGPPRGRLIEEKRAVYAPPRVKSKRNIIILAALAAFLLIIFAIVIPIYFAIIKPHSNKNSDTDTSDSTVKPSATTTGAPTVAAVVTGGDGSKVTMDDGTTFIYHNSFGGHWYWDENDPFNDGARAQSWSPALNETFRYGIDKIRGVNLGGWLNTEPFIVPALFEPYLSNTQPAVDEWTLSEAMRSDTANGGITQLEDHYKTFITEKDFAEIAGAGLNYVRIPLGYWAIEVRDGEPFLEKTSWIYFLKAIKWARKYGIRINLDLHAAPGSQNGWNHSGRLGTINVLNGPMGYANAQRTLDYIRILAEFISQPQYSSVVTMFGILNEPQGPTVGQDALARFYMEAYNIVRNAGGIGENKGPFISFHDGFLPRSQWAGEFPNADRMSIDTHPYICFGTQSSAPMSSYKNTPCTTWGGLVNTSSANLGLTTAGEFSNAVTDCGLWLNGVNLGTRYEGTYPGSGQSVGSCSTWTDWQNWDAPTKSAIKNFALASMDALQDYFFWTWKIGNSSVTGKVETPHWSYQLGLENGWMPTDPRAAIGFCGNTDPWSPPLAAWQTGGAGAGDIPASVTSALAWPPATLSTGGPVVSLPAYTPTGTVVTLPVPPFTQSSKTTATINAGSGWANSADTAGMFVAIPTCSYLDPWIGPTASPPSPLCSSAAHRRSEPSEPNLTPTPSA